jgi:uncharacterized protein YjaZ
VDIKLHITDNKGLLKPFVTQLERYFNETIGLVVNTIPIKEVDAWISEEPKYVIPELGIGGNTPTAKTIFIYLDSYNPKLILNLEPYFKSAITHELHHSLRFKYINAKNTLLEAMIREGLADHFDIEINGGDPKIWDEALSSMQIEELLKLAEKEYSNDKYDHKNWFYGSKEHNIPKWTGYTLGFYLVKEYLENNKTQKASTLYTVKAKEFIAKKVSTRQSSPVVTDSKTSPTGQYIVSEETIGDGQTITIKDNKGKVITENVISQNEKEIGYNTKIMCQCGTSFKAWVDNTRFSITIVNGGGEEYEYLVDAITGKVDESSFKKLN